LYISIRINPPLLNGGNHHQRDFSKLFRDIFHRPTKHKIEKELTTLSTTLMKSEETTDTLASTARNSNHEEICLFSDSPHYIVRV
jgi:hypothetical protein